MIDVFDELLTEQAKPQSIPLNPLVLGELKAFLKFYDKETLIAWLEIAEYEHNAALECASHRANNPLIKDK